MARSRIRSKGTGFSVTVDWDGAEKTGRAFRNVRRRVQREFDEIQAQAGEKVVLPDARRRAHGLKVEGQSVAAALIVRRGRAAPYITSRLRGRRARAIGLLEFGGTVRKEIWPRGSRTFKLHATTTGGRGSTVGRKRALSINGRAVAVVRTPRRYRPRRFMQDAAAAKRHAFAEEVRDQLVAVFGHEGFRIR